MNLSIYQITGFALASVIFWRSEYVINIMTSRCRNALRIAFWLLAVGSVSIVWQIIQGYDPSCPVLLMLSGVAFLLLGERRLRAILRG